MTATAKPEIGSTATANGIKTNYLEDGSGDGTVLLIQGSGPGVTSYANRRLVIPSLATKFRVVAPDMVGFRNGPRIATTQCRHGPIRSLV
jgi:pimeloyl-ACP methyl ester carboxylesterase